MSNAVYEETHVSGHSQYIIRLQPRSYCSYPVLDRLKSLSAVQPTCLLAARLEEMGFDGRHSVLAVMYQLRTPLSSLTFDQRDVLVIVAKKCGMVSHLAVIKGDGLTRIAVHGAQANCDPHAFADIISCFDFVEWAGLVELEVLENTFPVRATAYQRAA